MANEQLKEPQPNWLPFIDAIFRLNELIDGAESDEDRALEQYNQPSLSLAKLARVLLEKSKTEELKIDPVHHSFQFRVGPSSWIGGVPWEFLDELKTEIQFKHTPGTYGIRDDPKSRNLINWAFIHRMSAQQVLALRDATVTVWQDTMLHCFDQAVSAKKLTLYARIESAPELYQRIPSESWPILKVVNWQHGAAVAPGGTGYLSIHVCPSAAEELSAPAHDSSARPERERATIALDALYKGKIPNESELPNKHLLDAVNKHLKNQNKLEVKLDSVMRAAGRRG